MASYLPRACGVLLLASTLPGCGSSTFGGSSNTNRSSTVPAQTVGTGSDSLSSTTTVPTNPTAQQTAIGHCLQAWGNNPFGANAYTSFREISAAVSVLGIGGYAVQDTQATSQPALVVVDAAVSVLGNARYLLMNPNGWYCIMTDVNVLATAEVDLQCQAHLADSQVQVNVGSNSQAAAAVGVDVLSTTKVVKETADGTGGGC